MPIYEFYSPDTKKIYTFFARNREQAERIPKCPDNPEFRMVKVPSTFSISKGAGSRKSGSDEGGPESGAETEGPERQIDERAMMSVMGEMEKAIAGMDENNPDPRLLGRMMRRMAEVSGERLDGQMEEMVRKLEEGADPEKLEEEFGDLVGDEEGGGGYGGGVSRDPNIYDYD